MKPPDVEYVEALEGRIRDLEKQLRGTSRLIGSSQ